MEITQIISQDGSSIIVGFDGNDDREIPVDGLTPGLQEGEPDPDLREVPKHVPMTPEELEGILGGKVHRILPNN